MKKRDKILFIFIILISVGFLKDVSARISVGHTTTFKNVPDVRNYLANVNGQEYMTYCIDPGRQAGSYETKRTSLNPSDWPVGSMMYKYCLAAQIVYTQMRNNGLTEINDNNRKEAYIAGNTAFRIITQHFFDGGVDKEHGLDAPYNKYLNFGAGVSGDGAQIGINMAKVAVQFANANAGRAYSELVKEESLPGVKWTVVKQEMIKNSDLDINQLTIEIQPDRTDIYNFDPSKVDIDFSNQSVVVLKKETTLSDNKNVVINVWFKGTTWNKENATVNIKLSYCDPTKASSMLYLIDTENQKQRFIVVLPSNENHCQNAQLSTEIIPIEIEDEATCSCDNDTGEYIYQASSDAKTIKWHEGDPIPEGVNESICPTNCPNIIETCELDCTYNVYTYQKYLNDKPVGKEITWDLGGKIPPEVDNPASCALSTYKCEGIQKYDECYCDKKTMNYTYNKFKENGFGLSKLIFTRSWKYNGNRPYDVPKEVVCDPGDCGGGGDKHNCELPSATNGNKYYCRESALDRGDGPVCDEKKYKEQCDRSCSCDTETRMWTYTDNGSSISWHDDQPTPPSVDTSICIDTCPPPIYKCTINCVDNKYTYREYKDGKIVVEHVWNVNDPIPPDVNTTVCPPSCGEPNKTCECIDNIYYYYKGFKLNILEPNDAITWKYGTNPPPDVPNGVVCDEGNCGGIIENKCKMSTESSTGYFCADGSECNYEDFIKSPYEKPTGKGCGKYTCQERISDDGLDYYCKESEEGKGDGKPCTKADYYKECGRCDDLSHDSEEYKMYCLNCSPSVTIPSECTDVGESTSSAFISDINRIKTECNSDVNQVKYCVLGKEDATGESFLATNEISRNPYCAVWCDEKYDFKLPMATHVNSGRYFELQTTITGHRYCYVSSADKPHEPIDENKFNRDFVNAQHNVIDAWNEYSKWKEAASITATTEHISAGGCSSDDGDSGSGGSGGGNYSGDPSNFGGPGFAANYTNNEPKLKFCSTSTTHYSKDWSYTVYDYNGNSSTEDDSYESGSCGCDSCDDGVSPDGDENDENSHKYKRKKAKEELISAVNELNRIISLYNSCSDDIDNTNYSSDLSSDVNPSSTETSTWKNKMVFNPEVYFKYDEDYLNKKGEIMFNASSSNGEEGTLKEMYCSGDITDEYNCKNGQSSSVVTKDLSYVTCNESGCETHIASISSAKWIKKERIREATYKSDERFSTSTPYGTIKMGDDGGSYLWTTIPEHNLPIALKTGKGLYNYTFTFKDIGQSNSSGSLGRLIGNSKSVLTEFKNLKNDKTCDAPGVSDTTEGGYVCHYIVNCPECTMKCNPLPCQLDDGCDGPDCLVNCINCLFDGESKYTYRTVSLNNMFPNKDRTTGYNWNSDVNEKAKKTLETIEGESGGEGEKTYEKPQYSFTLTPTDLQKIREYNDKAGTYVNSETPISVNGETKDALRCEKQSFNGVEYRINCRSSFLDYMEDHKEYGTMNVRATSGSDGFELYPGEIRNGEGPSWRIKNPNKK